RKLTEESCYAILSLAQPERTNGMNYHHNAGPPATLPTQINLSPSCGSRPMDSKEAADYLRLSPRRVQEWARKGYLPGHPLGEGARRTWRFFEHELAEWLNKQTN